jgi:hypothetical protein
VSPKRDFKRCESSDLALRKHEVNPGSGRLQYADVNRTT